MYNNRFTRPKNKINNNKKNTSQDPLMYNIIEL